MWTFRHSKQNFCETILVDKQLYNTTCTIKAKVTQESLHACSCKNNFLKKRAGKKGKYILKNGLDDYALFIILLSAPLALK
jgi:hypothetical protein